MPEVRDPRVDPRALHAAVEALERGGLVVFPTDTVYGVGASVHRPEGVARLYVAKGRPLERPIPVLVSNPGAVGEVARKLDARSRALMDHFWPGPLTIVLPAASWLPVEIVRGTDSVGVRMPDHPIALELIERTGGALATTSANRSGAPETRTAGDAASELGETVDLVLDGGETPGGVPSTVVRVLETGELEVLRVGALDPEELRQSISSVR
jgi:L-threonylcarbamoyladenylate synthase